jgi:Cytochrome P460
MPRIAFLVFALLAVIASASALRAGQEPDGRPQYTNGTSLVLPADYREWTWLSSGLGMTYEVDANRPERPPAFTNVFVNPSSYKSFMKTGKWPNRTVFILEVRESTGEGSINKAGRFQGAIIGLEAEVKDSRFPDGWAFFNFGPPPSLKKAVEPIADSVRCVECHTRNTAVERTFVQFYPTLMDAARRFGTVKPGF